MRKTHILADLVGYSPEQQQAFLELVAGPIYDMYDSAPDSKNTTYNACVKYVNQAVDYLLMTGTRIASTKPIAYFALHIAQEDRAKAATLEVLKEWFDVTPPKAEKKET